MSILTTKKVEDGKVILNIEVPFSDYEKHIRHAAAHIAEHIEIKGFRKGMAPYDMIVNKVGEMGIYEEALQDIIEESYTKAIQENEIKEKVFYDPEIKIEKIAPNNPIIFTAELMIVPEIKLGKYVDLKMKKEVIDENSEDFKTKVDQSLNGIIESKSKAVLKTEPIEKGDKATLNMDLFINGVPLEDGRIDNYTQLMDEKMFIPGFIESVIGLKSGDKKEFELTFPTDYFDSKVAGKKVIFKVEILAVYKIEKPELNDELAKELGSFETFDQLKKQITDNVKHELEHKNQDKKTVEMLNSIIKDSNISKLQDRLIMLECKKMLEELKNSLVQNGMDYDKYKEAIGKTDELLMEEFKPKAEERLKMALIIDAIAEKESIKVTQEEVSKEIEDAKKYYSSHPDFENIKHNLEHPSYLVQLEKVLRNEKVMNFLREKNLV